MTLTNTHKTIGLVCILVILILIGVFAKKCDGNKVVVTGPLDSTFYWKDKYNNNVASLKGYEAQFAYEEKKLLDSIAKVHNSKVKYIKEYVTITEEGKTVIVTKDKPVITYVDSGKGKEMKSVFQMFENPYYIAEATIDLTGKDSSKLALQTVDTLSVVWKEVKEGNIFHRKTFLQLDVSNKNPYNQITGLQAYRVALPKPKKFGVGIQVGYGFAQGITPQPYLGVGVQWSVIRF